MDIKYEEENVYLLNGDCLKLMKDIPDEGIDLIVTDPPYKTTSRGKSGTKGIFDENNSYKNNLFKHNDLKISDYIEELYRVLKDTGHCYIFCNQKNLLEFLNVVNNSQFNWFKNLIWVKDNKVTNQFYMTQFEYILFLRKGKAKKINNCGTSEVLFFNNKKTKNEFGENIHPTEKPVDLLECLIKNSSTENDTVLDCFMGSGSTGVACKHLNRIFIGIELDKGYFETAKRRIKNERY